MTGYIYNPNTMAADHLKMDRYREINDGVAVKVSDGYLWVRTTAKKLGCLEQGGRADRVVKCKFGGTIEDAMKPVNEFGTTMIDRIIQGYDDVIIVRHGHVIR